MTTHTSFGGMAFEPENLEQEQETPELNLSQTESGSEQVPQDLLQQISDQISGLAEQVSELKGEITSLKADNSSLREQLTATPASAAPAANAEPEVAQEVPEAPTEEESWKTYEKDEFASDFEDALANMSEVDWDEEQPEDDNSWPDQEPFISKEMVTEMEEGHVDMMDMIANFNTENPADYVQNDPTASTGLPTEPEAVDSEAIEAEAPTEPEAVSGDTSLDDDEIQKLLAVAEQESTEVVEEEVSAEDADDSSTVSDDEIQAMLAEAAGDSESQETAEAESTQPSAESETDEAQAEQVVAEEESADDERTAMSEDEIASLMAEANEVASEAAPVTPTALKVESEEESSAEDEETVEVGFTAFQAGKDVDDDLSAESDDSVSEEVEVEIVEKREVIHASFEIDKDAIKKVPAHLAIAALAVPVLVTEEGLVCKVAMPIDRASIDLIEDAVAMQVVPEPAPMEEVLDALRKSYGTPSLWKEREAVMIVAPATYKPKKGKKKNFFGRAA